MRWRGALETSTVQSVLGVTCDGEREEQIDVASAERSGLVLLLRHQSGFASATSLSNSMTAYRTAVSYK
jgi:hypothetical protein